MPRRRRTVDGVSDSSGTEINTELVTPDMIVEGDVILYSAADSMTVEDCLDGEIVVRGFDTDGDVFSKRIPARHFFGGGGKLRVSRGMDDFVTRVIPGSSE